MKRTFGKAKLIRDISANTLQTGITQLFGLVIFYITSKYLAKEDFGELNWSMAVGSTAIAIASLGLDLIFVKRIASGANVLESSGIHLFHTVLVGAVLGAIAYTIRLYNPEFNIHHPLFFLVFINLAIANIANSFKLCLNGLESYRQLAILAFISNIFKLTAIILLFTAGYFSIVNIIFVYISTSLIELIIGYWLTNLSIAARVRPLLKMGEYKYFILESLPQLGVVLFDSALARLDWILLGIISTATATAEYSFAYKIFELSKLPLLIIAPVLLTRFSKIFSSGQDLDEKNQEDFRFFFKLEMFVLMFIPLFLVSTWSPLIDFFTDDKYGRVNEVNFWLLAACVPLHGIINYFWTLAFVQGQLKVILFITITVSMLNLIANAVFIPLYDALGSAIAFLICTIIQMILYLIFVDQSKVKPSLLNALISIISALLSLGIAMVVTENILLRPVISVSLFILLGFITRQFQVKGIMRIIKG
jgi:O-antigen/teichoic acid export membrane protein